MAPTIREIELRTGVTLSYATQGASSGMPVIFLHGLSDSWRSFEPILPRLPESIQAFALSLRGHGDSDRPPEGYGIADFAADLEAFMDQLRLDRAVLVGHSGSTPTVQRFAIDHPERTLGLVLVGAFADMTTSPAIRQFWESAVSQLEDPIDEDFLREFQASVQPLPQEFFDTVIEESSKVPARVWKQVVSATLRDNVFDEIHNITAPTLIVWADQDEFISRDDQERLKDTIPDARLIVYPDVGHNLHWEDPDQFASDLTEFLNKNIAPRLNQAQGDRPPSR